MRLARARGEPGRAGLGTIIGHSRRVTLVIHGVDKQEAARRVLAASDFDPEWPATFIHGCPEARIWLDEAAFEGAREPTT